MNKLLLVSVFWANQDANEGEDATVCVEDGVVVYITRADGLEVRLLVTELDLIYQFALEQIFSREEP